MKKIKRAFLIAAVVACGVFASVDWSQNDGLSLSASSAQARVGRPATPASAAGVRAERRVEGSRAERPWEERQ